MREKRNEMKCREERGREGREKSEEAEFGHTLPEEIFMEPRLRAASGQELFGGNVWNF